MLINKIIPLDIENRICVHCDTKDVDGNPITYLIADKNSGKSTETIRQAVFRRAGILTTEYDFYNSAGMKHISETHEGEVGYMGLRDLLGGRPQLNRPIRLCVDNGREVLEQLLTYQLGVPVSVDFIALED